MCVCLCVCTIHDATLPQSTYLHLAFVYDDHVTCKLAAGDNKLIWQIMLVLQLQRQHPHETRTH